MQPLLNSTAPQGYEWKWMMLRVTEDEGGIQMGIMQLSRLKPGSFIAW